MLKSACSVFVFSFFCFQTVRAATVDTVDVFSAAMNKKVRTVIITPNGYAVGKDYPVVYLLHGYSGNHSDWLRNVPSVKDDADLYRVIVVCPDAQNSWYYDSPVNPAIKYETFVVKELVQWIDQNYKTKKDRSARGITGLSMGGHGALYLSLRHQDVYGAAGSMSGGVDIRPFPNNWELALLLGSYAQHSQNWEQHTVINSLPLLTPNSLALTIDCGTGDFFFAVNNKLHDELMYRNIPHDYTVRPGVHNWTYWSGAVHYQLLFMHRYFTKSK